eukprot:CAMPEP_0170621802 /NCGR_PEP_ID=MMETSP0224-20130122/28791_1 /TAXON_ID=285029 /ORGANISM="Togula jolla, Strain CCCM 725" /LENGTH=99 /DNA_ID=CAMNT_0010948077 /DNA_START=1 /DNA_END=298 /DNA_ORIENTATION=+
MATTFEACLAKDTSGASSLLFELRDALLPHLNHGSEADQLLQVLCSLAGRSGAGAKPEPSAQTTSGSCSASLSAQGAGGPPIKKARFSPELAFSKLNER